MSIEKGNTIIGICIGIQCGICLRYIKQLIDDANIQYEKWNDETINNKRSEFCVRNGICVVICMALCSLLNVSLWWMLLDAFVSVIMVISMEFGFIAIKNIKQVKTLRLLLDKKDKDIDKEKKLHKIDVDTIRLQIQGQQKEYFRLLEENNM